VRKNSTNIRRQNGAKMLSDSVPMKKAISALTK